MEVDESIRRNLTLSRLAAARRVAEDQPGRRPLSETEPTVKIEVLMPASMRDWLKENHRNVSGYIRSLIEADMDK